MSKETAHSQTLKAILGLRGLILDGVLRSGERVSELLLAERLGVSRTPARQALMQLREEGLLESRPSTGYIVSEFSEADAFDAIDIRGTLEGMAARLAAERGAAETYLARMQACVDDLDRVVDDFGARTNTADYLRLNDQFHALLVEAAQSPMVKRSLSRVYSLPFAAPNAFVDSSRSDQPGVKRILIAAQEQHRAIVDAIRRREGTRAQNLAIEHARSAAQYLQFSLDNEGRRKHFPALTLISQKRSA